MLKKFLATGALALSVIGITAASASATPIPYIGGDVSITVADVQYNGSGACQSTPVTITVSATDEYAYYDYTYDATYTGPTTVADYASGYGAWSGTFAKSFLICPNYDQPGAYNATLSVTFYDYNYNIVSVATASDAFTVTAYTPPTPPAPPAPPAPPVVTPSIANVQGYLDVSRFNSHRVALTTYTAGQPTNTTAGAPVMWKIKADNRLKAAYTQGFDASRTTKVNFPAHSGTHKVRVYMNGSLAKTITVRTGH
jgi:hypothetical protein